MFLTQRRGGAEGAERILELGLYPRPQTTLNHRRLVRFWGMGWNPISKSISASLRLCVEKHKRQRYGVEPNLQINLCVSATLR